MTDLEQTALELVARIAITLEGAGINGALIGGHAVNVWVEPRLTVDIDVAVMSGVATTHLSRALTDAGFTTEVEVDANAKSGPGFLRIRDNQTSMMVDFLVAKTDFETGVVTRAIAADGLELPVATAEDLVVLKLISFRPKDQKDLLELGKIEGLDWSYVEHWASIWDVKDRLAKLREWLEHDRQIERDLGL